MKIWEVEVGNNFNSLSVVASSIEEAIKKVKKTESYTLLEGSDQYISKAELMVEVDLE